MKPIPFSIVGAGWRAEFYLRIARALPDRFAVAGMVVRDARRASEIERIWGIRTYRDVEGLLNAGPGAFCVTSVSWASNPGVIEALVDRDVAVLSETPPAPDRDALSRLLRSVRGKRGRVQVAEEYHLRPEHQAQAEIVRRGLLGDVDYANISVGHGYHGISLMRRFLSAGYMEARASGFAIPGRIVKGPDRSGPPTAENVVEEKHAVFVFRFADGRTGIVDFADSQYFAWIRSDRVLVRGTHGELDRDEVRHLRDFKTPIRLLLERVETGRYGSLAAPALQGFRFGDDWIWRNPFPVSMMDDEIAIAEALVRMAAFSERGTPFYPLEEGMHDHALYLGAQEAVAAGAAIGLSPAAWGGP